MLDISFIYAKVFYKYVKCIFEVYKSFQELAKLDLFCGFLLISPLFFSTIGGLDEFDSILYSIAFQLGLSM